MKLSLSGRIIEVKYKYCQMSVEEFVKLAGEIGYDAVELRRTQISAETPAEDVRRIRQALDEHGVGVSRFPAGKIEDDESLKQLGRFADMAVELGCPYLSVGFAEISRLRKAADYLKERSLGIVIQTHTDGPFETPKKALKTLKQIDRDNFGLMFDPANYLEKGVDYLDAAEQLKDHVFMVSVQDAARVDDETQADWQYEGRYYKRHLFGEPGGIDFQGVFKALDKVDFDGYVTVIEPISDVMNNLELAEHMYSRLKKMISRR